jgi:glycosyltransferase involved in cell wall biosynthesis
VKVGILARGLGRPGGVGRLLDGYLSSLPAAAPDWTFYAFTDAPLPERFTASNLYEILLPRSNAAVFDHYRVPRAARAIGLDVFFATKNSIPRGLRCPAACVFLDLAYFAEPSAYPFLDNVYMRAMFRSSARRASRIVAISRRTAEDMRTFLSEDAYAKTRVVYPGIEKSFRVMTKSELATAQESLPPLPERFVLYAGNISPRKNLERLLEAFASIEPSVGLVITGHRRWKSPRFDAALAGAGKKHDVVVLGGVSSEGLVALYNLAAASVYPSLYEGFGLPIVESLACGTPPAVSDRPPMTEAAGDAAVLFDPENPGKIADALGRILTDARLRADLRERGLRRAKEFSWEKAAGKLIETLGEIA